MASGEQVGRSLRNAVDQGTGGARRPDVQPSIIQGEGEEEERAGGKER